VSATKTVPKVNLSAAGPMPQLVITVSQLDMATGKLFLIDSQGNVACLLQDHIHFTESTSTVTVDVAGPCAAKVQDLDGKRAKFLAIIFSPDGADGEMYHVSAHITQAGKDLLPTPVVDTGTFQNLSHASLAVDFAVV
jgi:hypothetical protein